MNELIPIVGAEPRIGRTEVADPVMIAGPIGIVPADPRPAPTVSVLGETATARTTVPEIETAAGPRTPGSRASSAPAATRLGVIRIVRTATGPGVIRIVRTATGLGVIRIVRTATGPA